MKLEIFILTNMSNIVKRALVLFPVLFLCLSLAAERKTKLVVGVVISHFYPEWLEMYENELSNNGFKRITRNAKKLNMNYNYIYTQTGVDHATIYSGMLPAEHGIVSRMWYDRLRKRRMASASSEQYFEVGGSLNSNVKSLSPDYLQTISLGSVMKLNNSFSKVYSVAMNGEEAVFSGGSSADLAIWFDEKTGKWITSSFYTDKLPDWLTNYNTNLETDNYIEKGWMNLADENKSGVRLRIGNSFYYDLAKAKREYNTYRVLKATPYANTMVRSLAEKIIDEERLGRDNEPDLLAINFSCLDYMHRDYSVDSPEERDVLQRLDNDIELLLNYLDAKVGIENYTIFVTFSEARELTPTDLRKVKLNSDYFSVFRAVALMRTYLNLVYGPGEWIIDYDHGQIYLNRDLVEERKYDLKEMQDKVADFLIDFEGVAKVITAYSMTHTAFPDGINRLMQNAFSHKRSGDVMFCLNPTWSFELKEMEDMYFRHSKRPIVPFYIYGAGVVPSFEEDRLMTDLLPTLCKILGISKPYSAKGNSVFK